MADFEDMVIERPYYLEHPMLGSLTTEHDFKYLNEGETLKKLPDNTNKYADGNDAKSQLVQAALKWPYSLMSDDGFVQLPFIVAAVAAFWVTPMVVPDAGIGSALATGYVAGGLDYLIQYQNKTFVKLDTKK